MPTVKTIVKLFTAIIKSSMLILLEFIKCKNCFALMSIVCCLLFACLSTPQLLLLC